MGLPGNGRFRAPAVAAGVVALACGVLALTSGDDGGGRRDMVAGTPAGPHGRIRVEVVEPSPGPGPGTPVPLPPPPPPGPGRAVLDCVDLAPVAAGEFDERHVEDVAVAGGGFVAGVVDRCGDRHLQLWRSADGTTWTPVPVDGSSGVALDSLELTAVDDHVAVLGDVRGAGEPAGDRSGDGRVAWTTADQRVWHRTDLAALAGGALQQATVVAAGGGFVALATTADDTGSALWWSPTGEEWTPLPPPDGLVDPLDVAGSREAIAVLGSSGTDEFAEVVAVAPAGPTGAWSEQVGLDDALRDQFAVGLTGYPDGLALDLDTEMANGGPTVWATRGRGDDWVPLVDRARTDDGGLPVTVMMAQRAWVGAEGITAAFEEFSVATDDARVVDDASVPPLVIDAATSTDDAATWERHRLSDEPALQAMELLVAGPRQLLAVARSDTDLAVRGALAGRESLYELVVVAR